MIVAADGKPVDQVSTLQRIIRGHKPGDVVDVDVMRYGEKKAFKVKLAEAPTEQQIASAAKSAEDGDAASTSRRATTSSASRWKCCPSRRRTAPRSRRTSAGLAVMDVDAMGPAYRLLLPGRDVIVKVLSPKARAIRSVADLNAALGGVADGEVISLLVYNSGNKSTRVVNLRVGG